MDSVLGIDWHAVWVPTIGLLELVLRGSVMYLGILAALRFFRRDSGALNTADLLVLVLVADAAQNAMASEYHSLTEGVVLVATIFAWNYTLDWLGYRFRWIYRLLHSAPLPLVENGRINRHNLRIELLRVDDLMEQLREQGIEDVRNVKRCCLEADGRFSVIRQDSQEESGPTRKEILT